MQEQNGHTQTHWRGRHECLAGAAAFMLRAVLFLCVTAVLAMPRPAAACCVCPCVGSCNPVECVLTVAVIGVEYDIGLDMLTDGIEDAMDEYEEWLMEVFFEENLLQALQRFSQQMSALGMHQMFIVAAFLDSKHQLETQRLFQQLQYEAQKDYQPSEDFCWFGTNTRSLAHSETLGIYNASSMARRSLARQMGEVDTASARSRSAEKFSRWEQFVQTYCDPRDNNWHGDSTGLVLACGDGGPPERQNIDINYARLVDVPRSLDVDFSDDALTAHEEDVIAMANNLYGHDSIDRGFSQAVLANPDNQAAYMRLRSVAARRAVAEASFNAIVGMKSAGSSDREGDDPPESREYLAAILRELNYCRSGGTGNCDEISDEEIFELLGERPSFYAQLEILAKKIYQAQDFYAGLYDTPANVERKTVAMQAVELMLDRAIFESQLRREMIVSVMLSTELNGMFKKYLQRLDERGARQ